MIDRRTAITGIGGAAALSLAGRSQAAPVGRIGQRPGKPQRLRPGDTVGLVAPAGFVADRFGLDEISETVRAMGLVPKLAPNLLERHGYLAGTDEHRAAALNAMFADAGVRAVFAVRGGWGCERILPLLDYASIAANPKLLIGSSDIPALHLALAARTAMPSIHGPNLVSSWTASAWDAFRKLVFEGDMPTYQPLATFAPPQTGTSDRRNLAIRTFHPGTARGRLLGGNLSVLSALVGTPWLPDFTGAILFLEETNEAEYRIDRMLSQLALSCLLGKVAGVVFGQCTNCTNPGAPYSNFTVFEVIEHHLGRLGVPAFQGAQIGHIAGQISLPVGCAAEIDADAGTIRMLEAVVS